MGNHQSVSLYEKSPQEHIEEAAKWRRPDRRWGDPPPGYVRVKFYRTYHQICDEAEQFAVGRMSDLHDLQMDFHLDSSGGLDLIQVKRTWGLDNCFFVETERYTWFRPKDEDRLCALSVRVLSEHHNCLKVIEGRPCLLTKGKRFLRKATITTIAVTYTQCCWMQKCALATYQAACRHYEQASDDPEYIYKQSALVLESYTPFPRWYRNIRELIREAIQYVKSNSYWFWLGLLLLLLTMP